VFGEEEGEEEKQKQKKIQMMMIGMRGDTTTASSMRTPVVGRRGDSFLLLVGVVVIIVVLSGGRDLDAVPVHPPALSDTFSDPLAVVWFAGKPQDIGTISPFNTSVWSSVDAASNITQTRL